MFGSSFSTTIGLANETDVSNSEERYSPAVLAPSVECPRVVRRVSGPPCFKVLSAEDETFGRDGWEDKPGL